MAKSRPVRVRTWSATSAATRSGEKPRSNATAPPPMSSASRTPPISSRLRHRRGVASTVSGMERNPGCATGSPMFAHFLHLPLQRGHRRRFDAK
jgi:hypothetical protein